MDYRYLTPHSLLSDYVRTVLVLEGFAPAHDQKVPLFTNGMPAFYSRTVKSVEGNEKVAALTLFGRSTPEHCWTVEEHSTVIAYFFKPFALATLFNVPAK